MRISENFTLKELTISQTAVRKQYKEQFDPSAEIINNLKTLAEEILQPARARLGCPIRVSSGYRCLRVNKSIGGSSTSDHVKGLAADVHNTNGSDIEIAKVILLMGLPFKQMIIEFGTLAEPSWIHISYDKFNNKQQILRAYKQGRATKYKTLTRKDILDV